MPAEVRERLPLGWMPLPAYPGRLGVAGSVLITEYHSKSGSELEQKQITLVNPDKEFMFLNIWFPLPYHFPKLYLILKEVMSNLDDALPKPYVWEHSITKIPDSALRYIINHFNIERVSRSI